MENDKLLEINGESEDTIGRLERVKCQIKLLKLTFGQASLDQEIIHVSLVKQTTTFPV